VHKETFERLLERPADSHKYQYGHVLVVGGSPGMVGAPLLSGMAALRTGAGLVTVAAEPAVTDKLERRVKEIMTLALDSSAVLETFITDRKVSVIVIGPGLKPTPESDALLKRLLRMKLPTIIDGGGLTLAKKHLDQLHKAVILTPHTGEFQRLIDGELPEKRQELKPIVRRFAKTYEVTLVLKGQPTYVARPDGKVYENSTGNPGLATAGTGDVLTGVIAGLIAQNIEPEQAAEAAVYLHGLAGDIAAAQKTEPGMIAGDVIEALPEALRRGGGL
jgi:ADP-dependent NAD(P)H-hydrate dehydratase / NAD(P)H-hydrate epimerase